MRCSTLTRAAISAIAVLAISVPGAAAADGVADTPLLQAPVMKSAGGLTVTDEMDVSPNTFDVMVSTPKINPAATKVGLGIRIVLPTDYATSGKRYPVVYLLHGAGGSPYWFWDKVSAGVVQNEAADQAIIVMPDGGKNGWYTNWLSGIRQDWKDFHNDQVVPFIDANLRTIATREGRAIAGLSMGGFGATRYAGERPDLYSAVASMSGATNIQLPQFTGTVMLSSQVMNLDPFGAFGSPMWPFNGAWYKANPVNYASRYGAVKTFMTVGAKNEIAEMAVREATYDFANALKKAKVPYDLDNYGQGGVTQAGPCTGGHEAKCAPFALERVFPKLLAVLADPQ